MARSAVAVAIGPAVIKWLRDWGALGKETLVHLGKQQGLDERQTMDAVFELTREGKLVFRPEDQRWVVPGA